MNSVTNLTKGVVQFLFSCGLWVGFLSAAWLAYLFFWSQPASIPTSSQTFVPPHSAPHKMERVHHSFNHYYVNRDVFSYEPLAIPQPLAVLEEKQKAPKTQAPPPPPLPDIKGLVLTGIIKEENGSSWAIVEDRETRKNWLLTLGSKLRNTNVVAIKDNSVILQTDLKINAVLKLRELGNGTSSIPIPPTAPKLSMETKQTDYIASEGPHLGISVREATPEELKSAGTAFGVFIFKVDPKVPLKEGDILIAIDKEPTKSVEDTIQTYLRLRNLKTLELKIIRNGTTKFVAVTLQGA